MFIKALEFLVVSHIMVQLSPTCVYADDAIFSGIDLGSIKNLSRILKCFEISSGLKVNFHKSRLFGICVSDFDLQSMAQVRGCLKSSFPLNYLGFTSGC